jgi:hypothetical protein
MPLMKRRLIRFRTYRGLAGQCPSFQRTRADWAAENAEQQAALLEA